jgi:hypothetical protein
MSRFTLQEDSETRNGDGDDCDVKTKETLIDSY